MISDNIKARPETRPVEDKGKDYSVTPPTVQTKTYDKPATQLFDIGIWKRGAKRKDLNSDTPTEEMRMPMVRAAFFFTIEETPDGKVEARVSTAATQLSDLQELAGFVLTGMAGYLEQHPEVKEYIDKLGDVILERGE